MRFALALIWRLALVVTFVVNPLAPVSVAASQPTRAATMPCGDAMAMGGGMQRHDAMGVVSNTHAKKSAGHPGCPDGCCQQTTCDMNNCTAHCVALLPVAYALIAGPQYTIDRIPSLYSAVTNRPPGQLLRPPIA